MRIALYGEGSRDVGRVLGTAPVGTLAAEELGAAHILVQRLLVKSLGREQPTFIAPLLFRGRRAQGSDLLKRSVLKRLLAWPQPTLAPALAIVLVDCDGESKRYTELRGHLEGRSHALPPAVVAVAIQEFEAWLVADQPAVHDVLACQYETPPAPESMGPGEAKALLDGLMTGAGLDVASRARKRCEIAHRSDLAVVLKCSAFDRLRRDLHVALSPV